MVKKLIFPLMAVALSTGMALLTLEALLRFFPVSTRRHVQPVNSASPIMHYKPNNEFTFSSGWNFTLVNRGHINNYGYVNDHDYLPDVKTPLLAVIGDSYIDALMTPFAETVHGRLWDCFNPDYRVYSFSVSGSPLSQYLAYTRYVAETFAPKVVAVLVVGNDFDESVLRYKNGPGFHYFKEQPDGGLAFTRVDFDPIEQYGYLPGFIGDSALLRYFALNLQASILLNRKYFRWRQTSQPFVGNTSASADSERVELSKKAVNYFLEQMPGSARLEARNIVFIVDGLRDLIYEKGKLEEFAGAYFPVMREYFIQQAKARGFTVVDMQPVFVEHYKKHGQRFEYKTDGHWNGLAHGLAAKALSETEVARSVFASKKECGK
ncbi:MAG: hypothetical protein HQK86_12020 [Nitrospinae bacterium]|nr:hypothetical protein [Nitrospinota bacterium]